jgi:hypothetical protein
LGSLRTTPARIDSLGGQPAHFGGRAGDVNTNVGDAWIGSTMAEEFGLRRWRDRKDSTRPSDKNAGPRVASIARLDLAAGAFAESWRGERGEQACAQRQFLEFTQRLLPLHEVFAGDFQPSSPRSTGSISQTDRLIDLRLSSPRPQGLELRSSTLGGELTHLKVYCVDHRLLRTAPPTSAGQARRAKTTTSWR